MEELDTTDESKLCESFRQRYSHLLELYHNVRALDWNDVINEMRNTLSEYRDKTKDLLLDCIRNNKELSLSAKRSVNCVAVASAMFCAKFDDLEIETGIKDITDCLRENIESVLEYLSNSIVSVRLTEIMLYAMYTVCEEYDDNDGLWCSVALQCFNNNFVSDEIRLAAALLICQWKEDDKYVDGKINELLKETLDRRNYLGFKEKDIKYGLAQIEKSVKYEEHERALCEFFGKRYEYLVDLYKGRENISGRVLIKEMRHTLGEYKEKSNDMVLEYVASKRNMSLSVQISLNCVSVVSAMFCDYFSDKKIEIGNTDIGDNLLGILEPLRPLLLKSFVVMRMVEIILYVACTLRDQCKDDKGQWRSLALEYFRDKDASQEIKLASSVLYGQLDKDKKYVNQEMIKFLNMKKPEATVFGFKKEDIEALVTDLEQRDSGYHDDEDDDKNMTTNEHDNIKFFKERYEPLVRSFKDVEDIPRDVVIKEMRDTLRQYKERSNKTILISIENNQWSKSDEISLNCFSVVSAMFCEKFCLAKKKIESDIDDIIEDLYEIIESIYPHLSKGFVAVRMVEIILYVMCTANGNYKYPAERWTKLADQCFHDRHASIEIKLASSVLICQLDKNGEFTNDEISKCLHNTLSTKEYYGFQEEEIRQSVSQMHAETEHCEEQPRDSDGLEKPLIHDRIQLEHHHFFTVNTVLWLVGCIVVSLWLMWYLSR